MSLLSWSWFLRWFVLISRESSRQHPRDSKIRFIHTSILLNVLWKLYSIFTFKTSVNERTNICYFFFFVSTYRTSGNLFMQMKHCLTACTNLSCAYMHSQRTEIICVISSQWLIAQICKLIHHATTNINDGTVFIIVIYIMRLIRCIIK